ncbi:MAG: hypothetical protein ABL958_04360 [Bdellovibrionia bacterium]
MKKLILSGLLTLGFFPLVANAGTLIEPGIAYRTGTFDGGTGATGKVSGVGLTARLAMSFPMIFAGLDLGYNFGTITPDSGPSGDATAVTVGPVVGVSLPALPLRFWAAYLLWDYTTSKTTSAPAYDRVISGTGIKIGGGYTIIPLLSVNLDYVMHTYTKYDDKLLNSSGDLTSSVKGTDFVISASIPLDL